MLWSGRSKAELWKFRAGGRILECFDVVPKDSVCGELAYFTPEDIEGLAAWRLLSAGPHWTTDQELSLFVSLG